MGVQWAGEKNAEVICVEMWCG